MNAEIGSYRHTQRGPWGLLLYALGGISLIVGWSAPLLPLRITFQITGILVFLLGMSFQHLTVEDAGDHLALRFGPFTLFRKRIRYDAIRDVEKGRTTVLDGWGIHWKPWGGWVWNIWGFDCVVLQLNRGMFRVGTDDPDGLVAFLRSRIVPVR
jgi:hypothetical protein